MPPALPHLPCSSPSPLLPAFAQRDAQDHPRPRPGARTQDVHPARGLRGQPLRRRSAAAQADPDELRRRRAGCGSRRSEIYPQIKPGQKANDKIIVLEDTDGDGKADKTTVFADGLLIPTGVEPGDGGAYVANSTELVAPQRHRRRRQGRPEARSSSPASAPRTRTTSSTRSAGGRTAGCTSTSRSTSTATSRRRTASKRLNGGGIWQFRPETMELDVFARGLVNRWGHHFDRWGQSFVTDGAGGEGINYVVPGARTSSRPPGAHAASLHGLNPGSPKYCGLEIVSGRHLPGRLAGQPDHQRLPRPPRLPLQAHATTAARFASPRDDRGDQEQPPRVPADRREDGAGRRDLHRRLVQPDHPARRGRFPRPAPRPRRTAASGASPRRAARLLETRIKPDATIAELLDQLKSPEEWMRQHAKNMLKTRDKNAVLPALQKWVARVRCERSPTRASQLGGSVGLRVHRCGRHAGRARTTLAKSTDHRVQAAAMRTAVHWLPLKAIAIPRRWTFPRASSSCCRQRSSASPPGRRPRPWRVIPI